MKYLLSVMICINCLHSSGQQSFDTISKYSYLLTGVKSENGIVYYYPLGTCFFAKSKKYTYIITAKHCINGYNVFSKEKTDKQFDTVAYRYFVNDTPRFGILNTGRIKKYLPNDYFYETPDLVILPFFDTAASMYLNSIENYILKDVEKDFKVDSIISVGYAMENPSSFSLNFHPTNYSGIEVNYTKTDLFYPKNEKVYYTSTPKCVQGMSGSPVFLKCRNSLGIEKMFFGGLAFGSNYKYDLTYIIAADKIKEYLMERLSVDR